MRGNAIKLIKVIIELGQKKLTPDLQTLLRYNLYYVIDLIGAILKEKEILVQQVKETTTANIPSSSPRPSVQAGTAIQSSTYTSTTSPSLPFPTPSYQRIIAPFDTARYKRITIRLESPKDIESYRKASSEQLVSTFARNANLVLEGSIITARRNQSREGDIILQVATEQEKDILERNNNQIKELFKLVRLLRPTYLVIVYRVSVKAVDIEDQKGTIDSIKRQNAKLHLGLEITKVEQPAFAKKPTKTRATKEYTSLLLEVTKPKIVNRLIEERFIEGQNLLQYKKQDRGP